MSSQLQVSGEAKIRDIQGPVVANSGVITALDGAASQYVRGDGTLADFPTSSGGGSSVSYYLNGSVNQGTIGGVAYKELSKDPILGVGTDFTISANGYVASFITDANDPDSIIIPGGNWNTEIYFSVDSNSNSPYFYVEVYKYDGSTFTLLGSNQTTPEYITAGTTITPYYGAVAIPTTNTAITDRIAIRIYVVPDGRTVTLHTENSHLGQIVTTFSKGLTSLNNLTDQSQYLTTGTSGTDFNIVSSGDTHTFNIPSASASNRGLITTGAQTIAGSKTFSSAISADAGVLLKNGFTTYSNAYTSLSGDVGSLVISGSISSTPFDNVLAFAPLTSNTYTFPDVTGTIALLEGTQTFTGDKLFNGSVDFNNSVNINSGLFIRNNVIGSTLYTSFTITKASSTQTLSYLFSTGFASNLLFNDAANYSYTFPTASGTIALTSNLSSYVPYTGATTNVDLGVYSLTANQLIAGGANIDNVATFSTYDQGHALKLKGSTGDLFFVPYFSPSIGARITAQNSAASANTPLSFYASNFYFNSNVNFGSTLGNGTYTYTLPAATGTLALTSDLSAYLPLTGGTLTGALSGTSATFTQSSATSVNVNSTSTSSYSAFIFNENGTPKSYLEYINSAFSDSTRRNYTEIFNNVGGVSIWTNSIKALDINTSQAATFSSSVTANGLYANAGNSARFYRSANDYYWGINNDTNNYLNFGTFAANGTAYGTNPKMILLDNGNVGIGTSSPNSILEIKTSTATNSIRLGVIADDNRFNMISLNGLNTEGNYIGLAGGGSTDTNLFYQSGNGGDHRFRTGNGSVFTERMRITSGGSVTINGASTTYGMLNVKQVSSQIYGAINVYSNNGTETFLGIGNNGSEVGLEATYGASGAFTPIVFKTSAAERMRITSGGNVLIGTTTDSSGVRLKVAGGIIGCLDVYNNTTGVGANVNIDANGFFARSTSSLKYKKNINNLTKGLNEVLQLRPVTYNSINETETQTYAGLIAEEVHEIGLTEFVQYAEDGTPDALSYGNMVSLLVKAIQELEARIKQLENK